MFQSVSPVDIIGKAMTEVTQVTKRLCIFFTLVLVFISEGGGDEKDLLKDNLMRDIQDGFTKRRLPDGGFKVRQKE